MPPQRPRLRPPPPPWQALVAGTSGRSPAAPPAAGSLPLPPCAQVLAGVGAACDGAQRFVGACSGNGQPGRAAATGSRHRLLQRRAGSVPTPRPPPPRLPSVCPSSRHPAPADPPQHRPPRPAATLHAQPAAAAAGPQRCDCGSGPAGSVECRVGRRDAASQPACSRAGHAGSPVHHPSLPLGHGAAGACAAAAGEAAAAATPAPQPPLHPHRCPASMWWCG